MDALVEKWEAVASQPGANIIRIHAQENEKDMVDAFYTYMLGVDTDNHDVPVIFESIYHADEQYTKAILDELTELIHIWNTSNKDALSIKTEAINWQVNYKSKPGTHPAALFVDNMNSLAAYLNMADNTFLMAVLKVSFVQPYQFCRWLEEALKAGMSEKFKIVIDDSVNHSFYDSLAGKYPQNILTLRPQLDMDKAMQQVAAMGNPNDPAVQYRQAFIKMMQAIEQRKENDAEKHGNICLAIAQKNLEKNSYWIGQVIAVYAALANDQVGYRNFKKAIAFATKAVDAAEQSQHLIPDEFVRRKFKGQAIMVRASLYAADKNWLKAVTDFNAAAEDYISTNDVILAMEAYRMTGFCYDKAGNNDAACKSLETALRLSLQIPLHLVKFTTFAGVVELLLKINNLKYISQQEVEETAEDVYGKDWFKEITNWKNPKYEEVTDPAKTVAA